MDAPVTPPPPVPNQNSIPVPPSSVGSAPLPMAQSQIENEFEDDIDPAVAALSPQAILAKKRPPLTPPAPVASMQAPSLASVPGVSREELIAQAAKAPDTTLILPDGREVARPIESAFNAPNTPPVRAAVTPIPAPPLAPRLAQESFKAPVPTPPLAPLSPAADPALTMSATPPNAVPVPPAPVLNAQLTEKPKRTRNIGLISGIGGVLALSILAGTAYALAIQGVRVPLVFTWVSGLEANGVTQAGVSKASVATQAGYQYSTDSVISITAQGGAEKPGLPNSGTTSTTASVAKLETQVQAGHGTADGALFTGNLLVKADGGIGVPVLLRTGALSGETPVWLAQFTLSSTPATQQVRQGPLRETLVYPALQPIPVHAVLGAVEKETGYSKRTRTGTTLGVYAYALKAESIVDYLPIGATVTSAKTEVGYAWKTGLPQGIMTDIFFTFADQEYVYRSITGYTAWTAEPGVELSNIANATATAEPQTPASFVSQLGITSTALPGSANAALADAKFAPAVVSPKGQAVTVTRAEVLTIPALPATPASTAAKGRDSQRQQDLKDIQTALERYAKVRGGYPVVSGIVQTGSSTSFITALVPTYITAMPIDPLPDTYWYEYSSDGKTYRLRSVAEDATNTLAKKGAAFSYFELSK